MPGVYEYIISMQDRASGTLQRLTGSSVEAVGKFLQLQEKTEALQRHVADFGNSIGTLKQKIDILQQERDLIDPANLTAIQQYNREINALSNEVQNLENTTGQSKIAKNFKEAVAQIPGADLITNPLVAIAGGIVAVGKMSSDWETGMAKINTTAKLSEGDLQNLSKTIKNVGVDAKADLSGIPDAYEKIISQTGDVTLSTDILAASLKGARAGFTDIDVVSGAAAQSLSAIGAGKATAQEVMDTLFAAKRVGAGEFADFANNIPGLIASGKNVGVTWRDVSGAFAYMTGKGNDAATSTMLLHNAFTALGKSEITGGLKKAGIDVYDAQGKMRGLLPIMTELSALTTSMSDQQKSDFLESIGLKDAQAKQAFSVLTDETSKLQEAMNATANAAGEMQSAFDQTNTPANKIKESWSKIQGIALNLGGIVIAVLNPVLTILGGLLSGVAWAVQSVGNVWSWWTGLLQSGNPIIWGLTLIIGGLTAAVALHNLWLQKDVIWTGIVTAAKATWAAITGALTVSQWGLNTALLANPVTWVVVGIMALVAAFVAAWQYSEKFRGAMYGIWEVVKGFGSILKDYVIDRITGILSGLGGIASAIGKLFKGDFKGAIQEGKDALNNLSGSNAMKNAIDSGKQLGDKFKTGYANGVANFKEDKKDKKPSIPDVPSLQMPIMPDMPTADIDGLMAKLNAKKDKKALPGSATKKDDALSLGIPQDYNQSGAYSSITSKFGAQVDLAMMGKPENGNGKPENKTEKPVITMANRVDEIAGSLRRMAATVAIPIALGVGAGQAAAMQPLNWKPETGKPDNGKNIATINAPVANNTDQSKTLYNAFDNRLFQNSEHITDLSQKIDRVDNSISSVANTDLSRKIDQVSNVSSNTASTVANTDLSRKVGAVDNSTSKVANTDLSRKIDQIDNSASSLTANTDLSRKIDQVSNVSSNTASTVANTDLSRKVGAIDNSISSSVANNDLSRKIDQIDNTASTVANTDFSKKINQVSSTNSSVANTDLSRKIDQLTNNQLNQNNAVSNVAGNSETNLYKNATTTAANYDNSASSLTNNDNRTDVRSNVSTTNNTDQGRTIRIDRFTDKIEIHVTGVDAPQQAANEVRNAVEKALAEILNV